MKKITKIILLIVVLFTFSCSSDDITPIAITPTIPVLSPPVIPPPVVTVPNPVVSNILKPAIRNIGNTISKTNGKIAANKRLLKMYRFAPNKVNTNYKYKLYNLTEAQYLDLPTDNIYNTEEDSLNLETPVYYRIDHLYNVLDQLEKTEKKFINEPGVDVIENFTYTNNKVDKITSLQGGIVNYNTNGLIIEMHDDSGITMFTYSYDNQNRIENVKHYTKESLGILIDQEISYSYPSDDMYIKTWFNINPTTGTKERIMYTLVQHDPLKPGIYNKEPIYQIDNSYLHMIRTSVYDKFHRNFEYAFDIYTPKYFYDVDGYLMKYDARGINLTSSIYTFKYE